MPLGVVDGQRGEEAGQQVVADVGAGGGAQGAGRYVRADAGVPEIRAGLVRQRGREEVSGQVRDHDGVAVAPGVRAAGRHHEQVPERDLVQAGRGQSQLARGST